MKVFGGPLNRLLNVPNVERLRRGFESLFLGATGAVKAARLLRTAIAAEAFTARMSTPE
jgi:hypothetical protein